MTDSEAESGRTEEDGRALLVAIEFFVVDIDRALELLCAHFGYEEMGRHPHPDYDAEVVLVDVPPLVVSLVYPTDVGDREPFPGTEPRMSQLVFSVADEERFDPLREDLVEAGAAVRHGGPGQFHIASHGASGLRTCPRRWQRGAAQYPERRRYSALR